MLKINKNRYKAIIFDFDDTLVESRLSKWAQHKHVAKTFYNIDISDEDIAQHWGKPLSELIRILYKESDTIENMKSAIFSVKNNFLKKVFPDTHRVVTTILDNGMEVGILSASSKDHIIDDFTRLEFPVERFIVIQGEEDTLFHKPDPAVFAQLLEMLSEKGIEKKDILYVGDSLDDFHAATGAGINFIGVHTGLYSKDDFINAGAENILSEIGELLDYIEYEKTYKN